MAQTKQKPRQNRGWYRLGSTLELEGLAYGASLAKLGSTAQFTRLFVVLSLPQFLEDSAAFQQLLEATQS